MRPISGKALLWMGLLSLAFWAAGVAVLVRELRP